MTLTVSARNLAAFEQEMRKAKVDWQMVKYGGAVHSFTDWNAGNDNSKGAAYNEKADQRPGGHEANSSRKYFIKPGREVKHPA